MSAGLCPNCFTEEVKTHIQEGQLVCHICGVEWSESDEEELPSTSTLVPTPDCLKGFIALMEEKGADELSMDMVEKLTEELVDKEKAYIKKSKEWATQVSLRITAESKVSKLHKLGKRSMRRVYRNNVCGYLEGGEGWDYMDLDECIAEFLWVAIQGWMECEAEVRVMDGLDGMLYDGRDYGVEGQTTEGIFYGDWRDMFGRLAMNDTNGEIPEIHSADEMIVEIIDAPDLRNTQLSREELDTQIVDRCGNEGVRVWSIDRMVRDSPQLTAEQKDYYFANRTSHYLFLEE